jgi:hypothetical protein
MLRALGVAALLAHAQRVGANDGAPLGRACDAQVARTHAPRTSAVSLAAAEFGIAREAVGGATQALRCDGCGAVSLLERTLEGCALPDARLHGARLAAR